jgi:hypothetical protein
MEYNCEKCEFTSKNKYDYTRHVNSRKHQMKSKKIYNCDICNKNFEAKSTYYHHKKNYIHNNDDAKKINFDNNDLKIKLLVIEYENKLLKNEFEKEKLLHEKEKEKVELLKDMIKNTNKTADKALKISEKSISAIKYANKNFINAPDLKPIDNFNLLGFNIDNNKQKHKLSENLLYYYENNSIHKIFGDHIVSIYKKDNINEQSMHATDTSRMNYIIKSSKNNNQSKWLSDKNGVIICDFVIDKLINKYIELLRWYNTYLITELEQDPGNPNPVINHKIKLINDMLEDVETGILMKETNKYIAPFFNLDKN